MRNSYRWFATISSLFVALTLTGCLIAVDDKDINGTGPVVEDQRSVSGFDGVKFAIHSEYYLEQGNETSLRIEAQRNLLPYIKTVVRGGDLIIETDDDINLKPDDPIRIYLTAPSLTEVALLGSGYVAFSTWTEDSMDVLIAGSGDVFMESLDTERFSATIEGSGNFEIATGTAKDQYVNIAGSGDYDAKNLDTETAAVTIAGSGNAFVRVSATLDVSIAGSGSVFYLGSPEMEISISGSGDVRKLDS